MSSNKTNVDSDSVPQYETLVATHEISLSIDLPVTYLKVEADRKDAPVVILIHGYEDTARAFLRRAIPHPSGQYELLVPNGLFPMPRRIEMGWRAAFAWYFAEHKKPAVIAPSVAVQGLVQLVEKLNLTDRPKVIVGFSQGGFLMPRLLPHLKNVKRAIGIGCLFRAEDYPDSLPCPVDGIHGTLDEVIRVEKGQETFAELKSRNPQGQFFEVKELTHTMNDEARQILLNQIKESFS